MVGLLAFTAGVIGMTAVSEAQTYAVETRNDVQYVEHDGVKLAGDLYRPQGLDKAPVVIAVHGGGWQIGSRLFYRHWGPFLARHGIALFAVNYRLMKPGVRTFPSAVFDVKAAIQFVRANAAELGVDPNRIAAMGDSAGAHLTSLVALAGDDPLFSTDYRSDPHATTPSTVKAVVAFYGVYDMAAQWQHDQLARPRDQITEKFLGASPAQNRRVFFDASPLSYVTIDKREKTGTRFLLIYGTHDDVVDPTTQSQAFLMALKQAQFFVRTIVVPGSGHFWATDPIEEPNSYGAQAAPRVVRFLQEALAPAP
jgi:acetyl esterase/lipase